VSNFAQIIRHRWASSSANSKGEKVVSLGLILVILLVIFLFGGFSGRFGGYGYGYGHGGIGIIGIILIIIVVLMLMGRL
jgi:Na+/melibiose symporter-like transporter